MPIGMRVLRASDETERAAAGRPLETRKKLAGSAGLSRRPRRNCADLLEHPEGVPVRPFLHDLAVLDSREVLPGHDDVLAGRRDAHQLAGVPAAALPARRHCVTFRDLVLDDDPRTFERIAVAAGIVLHALRPAYRLGSSRVVTDVVAADELVGHAGVLPDVFQDPSNDLLVAGRHRHLLLIARTRRLYARLRAVSNGTGTAGARPCNRRH